MYKYISNNPSQLMNSIPPWVVTSRLLQNEDIDKIIHSFKDTELARANLGESGIQNNEVRRSNVKFQSKSQENAWLFNKINSYIDSVNQQFFNFDLVGYTNFQYTEYNSSEKGHYDFHQDIQMGYVKPGSDSGLRKLTVVISLTQQTIDFEGGDFQITMSSDSKAESIKLNKGDAIVFPSFMIHRVTPVTSGIRKSLVAWVIGPKFR